MESEICLDEIAQLRVEVKRIRRGNQRLCALTALALTLVFGQYVLHPVSVSAQTTILDVIRARRIIVVDDKGGERIVLGTGTSETSGDANTSIKLTSPSSTHPIILSTTDENASISVTKRVFLTGNEKGFSALLLFRDEYLKGMRPTLYLGTDKKTDITDLEIYNAGGKPQLLLGSGSEFSRLQMLDTAGNPKLHLGVLKEGNRADLEMYNGAGKLQLHVGANPEFSRMMILDSSGSPKLLAATTQGNSGYMVMSGESKIRGGFGLTATGMGYSELYNYGGELMYAVQTNSTSFPQTFVKSPQGSQAWNAAGTFSTLKTFWDIFFK